MSSWLGLRRASCCFPLKGVSVGSHSSNNVSPTPQTLPPPQKKKEKQEKQAPPPTPPPYLPTIFVPHFVTPESPVNRRIHGSSPAPLLRCFRSKRGSRGHSGRSWFRLSRDGPMVGESWAQKPGNWGPSLPSPQIPTIHAD